MGEPFRDFWILGKVVLLDVLTRVEVIEDAEELIKAMCGRQMFLTIAQVASWAQADGTQKVEDKGPFGRERQRTLDSEILIESKRFITDAAKAGKPFFVWHNTTRMHYRTNLSPGGKSGYGVYAAGMMEMDDTVGELLKTLDELGIAENTMVMFSTDNGAASNSWPDGGNQPFRGEKVSVVTKAGSGCQ